MAASVYINDCLSKLLIPMNFYHDSRLPHQTSNEFCFLRCQVQGLVAKYIISANENSDSESSLGKPRGQTCQPLENSKREIARKSDVSTKLACNLCARFMTYKISRREIFSSGGRFFAAFQKDNTCYWQKKKEYTASIFRY